MSAGSDARGIRLPLRVVVTRGRALPHCRDDGPSRAALEALPKVELHCHIGHNAPADGDRPGRCERRPLPTADATEQYSYDSLDRFLEIFWLVQSTLTTRADWARLAYEAVVDGAAHGVVHSECFFTPGRHLATATSLREILAGLDEGLSAAEAETGTTCLLIGDVDRAFGPAAGLGCVEVLVRLRREGAAGCAPVD